MADSKPIPVRLSKLEITRLDTCAKKLGTTRASLIRYLVVTFLDHFEKYGEAILPLNWRDILKSQDGRTLEARRPGSYVDLKPSHPFAVNETPPASSATPEELKKAISTAEAQDASDQAPAPTPSTAAPTAQKSSPSAAALPPSNPPRPAKSKRRQKPE